MSKLQRRHGSSIRRTVATARSTCSSTAIASRASAATCRSRRDMVVIEIPSGLIVCPGLIDMHVHLREPGRSTRKRWRPAPLRRSAGGFTAVACMPNTAPVNDNAGVTEYILKKAAEANLARVYPIGAVSRGQNGRAARRDRRVEAGRLRRDHRRRAAGGDGDADAARARVRGMFDMPVIEHCEEQTLKGDGVAHEGFHASALGLRGIPGRGRVDHGAARHRARRAHRRHAPHRAHERAADARRGALGQAAAARASRARSRRITSC